MNDLKVFSYKEKEVRTVQKDGQQWWILKDVCSILEISNSRDVTARLDVDEKDVDIIDTLGGKQEFTIISESGLYNVILLSRKSEAKEFKRWITHEVLPAIRKEGFYSEYNEVPVAEEAFNKQTDTIIDKVGVLKVLNDCPDDNRLPFMIEAAAHLIGMRYEPVIKTAVPTEELQSTKISRVGYAVPWDGIGLYNHLQCNHISVENLSSKTGIRVALLSGYMANEHNPSAETRKIITDALGVSTGIFNRQRRPKTGV